MIYTDLIIYLIFLPCSKLMSPINYNRQIIYDTIFSACLIILILASKYSILTNAN